MISLKDRLEGGCGQRNMDLVATTLAISRIPYGRPSELTPDGVVDEWTGTCSTKHLLLAAVVAEAWPELRLRLWHRPYRVTRKLARTHWGTEVATCVPPDGLIDVHTFATLAIDGRDVHVDVTFPLREWDGRSDIPLACGDGEDRPAGDDPLASKAVLVARHCNRAVREPFIAALADASTGRDGSTCERIVCQPARAPGSIQKNSQM